MYMQYM